MFMTIDRGPKQYSDIANELIADIQTGNVPHVGTVQYLLGMSESSHECGLSVLNALAEYPELARQFDEAVHAEQLAEAHRADVIGRLILGH